MLNLIQYNEPEGNWVPYPVLTTNPNIGGIRIMANRKIPNQELIGKTFSRWTAIKEVEPYISPKGTKHRKMLCVCECGVKMNVSLPNLLSGDSKSCGCYRIENTGNLNLKHGMAGKTRIYKVWADMKYRCLSMHKNYGGRGIIVCDEWYEFIPFRDWAITHGYADDKFIDRKNVNANYEPGNCRFVSNDVSHRNTRLLRKTNTTGFRGVSPKGRDKFKATIMIDRKNKYLGQFETAIKAAKAYDKIAHDLNDGRPLNFNQEA